MNSQGTQSDDSDDDRRDSLRVPIRAQGRVQEAQHLLCRLHQEHLQGRNVHPHQQAARHRHGVPLPARSCPSCRSRSPSAARSNGSSARASRRRPASPRTTSRAWASASSTTRPSERERARRRRREDDDRQPRAAPLLEADGQGPPRRANGLAPRGPRVGATVPNAFTAASASCFAVLAIEDGDLAGASIAAAWWALYGTLTDRLDGAAAQGCCKAQSAFGVQFDSLADLAIFGVAPPAVFYALLRRASGARLVDAAAHTRAASRCARLDAGDGGAAGALQRGLGARAPSRTTSARRRR